MATPRSYPHITFVEHLITKHKISAEEAGLLRKLTHDNSPLSTEAIVNIIKQYSTTDAHRVVHEWPTPGATFAVWTCPMLSGESTTALERATNRRISTSWTSVAEEAENKYNSRVVSIRRTKWNIELRTHIFTRHEGILWDPEHESPVGSDIHDEEKHGVVLNRVESLVQIWPGGPEQPSFVTATGGSQYIPRKAAILALEWLLEKELPLRAPELHKFLNPTVFKDSDVRGFVQQKIAVHIHVSTEHKTKKNGRVEFDSKEKSSGFYREKLDESDIFIQEHVNTNAFGRGVSFDFTHSDHFTELVQVYFLIRHPVNLVKFISRTSVLGQEYVIGHLLKVAPRATLRRR